MAVIPRYGDGGTVGRRLPSEVGKAFTPTAVISRQNQSGANPAFTAKIAQSNPGMTPPGGQGKAGAVGGGGANTAAVKPAKTMGTAGTAATQAPMRGAKPQPVAKGVVGGAHLAGMSFVGGVSKAAPYRQVVNQAQAVGAQGGHRLLNADRASLVRRLRAKADKFEADPAAHTRRRLYQGAAAGTGAVYLHGRRDQRKQIPSPAVVRKAERPYAYDLAGKTPKDKVESLHRADAIAHERLRRGTRRGAAIGAGGGAALGGAGGAVAGVPGMVGGAVGGAISGGAIGATAGRIHGAHSARKEILHQGLLKPVYRDPKTGAVKKAFDPDAKRHQYHGTAIGITTAGALGTTGMSVRQLQKENKPRAKGKFEPLPRNAAGKRVVQVSGKSGRRMVAATALGGTSAGLIRAANRPGHSRRWN